MRKWRGAPPRSRKTVCSRSPSGRAEINPATASSSCKGFPAMSGRSRPQSKAVSPMSASAGPETVALRARSWWRSLAAALKDANPSGVLSVGVLELGLLSLCIVERQLPCANFGVEVVLDRVHLGRARIRLGPEVPRVGGMPAELEADEVVLLVVGQRAADAVFTHLFLLQLIRVRGRRPDRLRPPVHADRGIDVRLRDVGIQDAGRAHDVGVVRAFRRG